MHDQSRLGILMPWRCTNTEYCVHYNMRVWGERSRESMCVYACMHGCIITIALLCMDSESDVHVCMYVWGRVMYLGVGWGVSVCVCVCVCV